MRDEMTQQTFVDLSDNNRGVNAAALRRYYDDGHRWLSLKASEGDHYRWWGMQALAREWHALDKANRVIYYHWLYGTKSAQSQHDLMWSLVSPVFRVGDEFMTDFEDVSPSRWVSDGTHLAVVRRFDDLCKAHGPVLDYAPNWYIASMPQCRAYFKQQRIVESDYSHDPPRNPYGFNIVAHQFTDRARVAGFPDGVDCNRWLKENASSTVIPITPVAPIPTEEDMATIIIITKDKTGGGGMGIIGPDLVANGIGKARWAATKKFIDSLPVAKQPQIKKMSRTDFFNMESGK